LGTEVGRPTKRTPEREQRLLDALRAGNTRKAACSYAGVAQDAFNRWLLRFADFADAIQKAEADAEVRHVANIARVAQEGTWQASAWWLERRRPDDYGRRERLDLDVYIRERAAELGLDPQEALQAIQPRLKALPG